jgi:propanol-preferring alcohol dehydrogenase
LVQTGAPLAAQEIAVPQIADGDVLIRVKAAGICHSDAHYRSGLSYAGPMPITLGHEIAGVVKETGRNVTGLKKGTRVCVHYLAFCGRCPFCAGGTEQFCTTGQMIGKHRDGGYAEFVVVPQSSVFVLPEAIPFEVGAILMCSSATSFHALRKTRLKPEESVAVFGCGGLGVSAIQLAKALGAGDVFAVDINPRKLHLAKSLGAIPVNASASDPVEQIRKLTGRGVDVALELIGLPLTMRQAVQSLANLGRAGLVGLTREILEVSPYTEVLNKEAEIIGVSDHLASEIPQLLDLVERGKLKLDRFIRTVPLDASAINITLDGLEKFSYDVRVVIGLP